MSISANALSLVYTDYLELDEVKGWLQVDPIETEMDANLQEIISMSCQWVQEYLGRPIAPTTVTRRFNGWASWNGAYIMLPYMPVLEILSCVEYWGISGPHTLLESTPTNQVDGFQCEYPTGLMTRVFPGNVQKPWFPGSRNVEISWVAGYNPVPHTIRVATLELIGHWFRNTQQQRALGPGSGTQGDYSPMDEGAMFTGVPYRIMDLLEPKMRVGMG